MTKKQTAMNKLYEVIETLHCNEEWVDKKDLLAYIKNHGIPHEREVLLEIGVEMSIHGTELATYKVNEFLNEYYE